MLLSQQDGCQVCIAVEHLAIVLVCVHCILRRLRLCVDRMNEYDDIPGRKNLTCTMLVVSAL